MMKDEAGGNIIEEFVGLRSKLYAYKMFEGKEEMRCEGITKNAVERSITLANYEKCLFTKRAGEKNACDKES